MTDAPRVDLTLAVEELVGLYRQWATLDERCLRAKLALDLASERYRLSHKDTCLAPREVCFGTFAITVLGEQQPCTCGALEHNRTLMAAFAKALTEG